MRRALLVLTIALLLLVRVPLGAQDLVLARFGDYVESLRDQAGIPGLAAAIVGTNDILWERAFGWQDTARFIAARTDTPFHVDGLTQMLTSALVLRCVEEGRLSLDDRVRQFKPSSPDADATIRQILSHTSETPAFDYRPERLEPLGRAVRACTNDSFRETLANLLHRLAMIDSVPGPDIIRPETLPDGIPSPAEVAQYTGVLQRLAMPYTVDRRGAALPSQYPATTLTPSGGLISTVRDFAQFDLALKKGVLLRPETLALAWRTPVGLDRQPLPHGLGWFVQSYRGETIVWQFGVSAGASSSLLVTVPGRGITLVLLANSDGLVGPYPLATGGLTASPFGRLFLGLFVR